MSIPYVYATFHKCPCRISMLHVFAAWTCLTRYSTFVNISRTLFAMNIASETYIQSLYNLTHNSLPISIEPTKVYVNIKFGDSFRRRSLLFPSLFLCVLCTDCTCTKCTLLTYNWYRKITASSIGCADLASNFYVSTETKRNGITFVCLAKQTVINPQIHLWVNKA
jgi:hypothetical protein